MKTTALTLVLLLALTGTSLGEASPAKVDVGAAPTIDGTLGDEEWKTALSVELSPGGEAFLLRDDDALYVGVRVGKTCIPSLALLQGEKILVLHASASLGTAVYERSGDDGTWTATRGFTWRCRDGRTTTEERDRFFADEGWFATTVEVGRRGEAEYRIDRRLLTGDAPRLALVVCRLQPGAPTACAWPETVADGTKAQDLLFGKTPDLAFEPDTWAVLDVGGAASPAIDLPARLDDVETLAKTSPVEAYRALLDLLAEIDDDSEGQDRAIRLRRTLESKRAVGPEAAAQRKLESALKLFRKKLREVEDRHPGTRAARIAAERRASLTP